MKQLIFDFDGTLVESGPLMYSHLLDYTKGCNYSWGELRNFPSDDILKLLGISMIDLPRLIIKIRNEFTHQLSELPIVPEIPETIRLLKEQGCILHIISSNSEKNISGFLKNHNIYQHFSCVKSVSAFFGKSKAIERLLKSITSSKSGVLYIGDETRDIEAARTAGIDSVAVSWGFNSEEALLKFNPNHLARTPADLLKIIC